MKKAVVIGAGLLVLILWGDVLLHLLITAIELVLETMELVAEHLLEALLELTPYEAQAVTAWLGFGLLMLFLLFGFKKVNNFVQRAKLTAPVWWQDQKGHFRINWDSIGWQIALTGMALMLLLLYI
ncbi:hypothetical protein [Methylocaldum sp.]|uniref:hypothetical protein n=1 Tax=Methylocaldum sp. TaxID=1969727 RepID=UPI002D6523B8|nr:hypothetical protein [Methylocaldum sp.]HYE37441.1 hypothetical protein [Methylocaldum sp.]